MTTRPTQPARLAGVRFRCEIIERCPTVSTLKYPDLAAALARLDRRSRNALVARVAEIAASLAGLDRPTLAGRKLGEAAEQLDDDGWSGNAQGEPVHARWELFGRGLRVVARIQFARGRVTPHCPSRAGEQRAGEVRDRRRGRASSSTGSPPAFQLIPGTSPRSPGISRVSSTLTPRFISTISPSTVVRGAMRALGGAPMREGPDWPAPLLLAVPS
ncbi:MAG TPA: hypothetical protein VE441_00440 [Mycobacterium sp.]|nr:hypothetical protein [Mycobacterium sp.]